MYGQGFRKRPPRKFDMKKWSWLELHGRSREWALESDRMVKLIDGGRLWEFWKLYNIS